MDNRIQLPTEGGREPAREFNAKLKYVREVRADKVEGMEPVRRFWEYERENNLTRAPNSEGIDPTKQLEARLKKFKVVSRESEEEMEPTRKFPPKSRE
jgi:hypothetical protein